MKTKLFFLLTALVSLIQLNSTAQTAAPATTSETHTNFAIIPVPRVGGSITNRQALVLQRAKEATGQYDLEFIGDSITQGWE